MADDRVKPARGTFARKPGPGRARSGRQQHAGGQLRRAPREGEPDAPQADANTRIAKAMARAGLCSRREAERWIADGRVVVNGRRIETPAVDVGPGDKVVVDGQPLPQPEPVRLWRYHKPRGLVTTHADPEGRETVFDNLPDGLPRVISIGRLDLNTEGLLLLTNDGALARYLELPATGWLRRYRVRAHGRVTQADLDKLKDGITIEGVRYGPVEATLDTLQGGNIWLTLALREGKNREVRKILESLGLAVNRLIRVSYGPFQLLDLKPGEAEAVKRRVLADQLGAALADEFQLSGPDRDERERRERRRDGAVRGADDRGAEAGAAGNGKGQVGRASDKPRRKPQSAARRREREEARAAAGGFRMRPAGGEGRNPAWRPQKGEPLGAGGDRQGSARPGGQARSERTQRAGKPDRGGVPPVKRFVAGAPGRDRQHESPAGRDGATRRQDAGARRSGSERSARDARNPAVETRGAKPKAGGPARGRGKAAFAASFDAAGTSSHGAAGGARTRHGQSGPSGKGKASPRDVPRAGAPNRSATAKSAPERERPSHAGRDGAGSGGRPRGRPSGRPSGGPRGRMGGPRRPRNG